MASNPAYLIIFLSLDGHVERLSWPSKFPADGFGVLMSFLF